MRPAAEVVDGKSPDKTRRTRGIKDIKDYPYIVIPKPTLDFAALILTIDQLQNPPAVKIDTEFGNKGVTSVRVTGSEPAAITWFDRQVTGGWRAVNTSHIPQERVDKKREIFIATYNANLERLQVRYANNRSLKQH